MRQIAYRARPYNNKAANLRHTRVYFSTTHTHTHVCDGIEILDSRIGFLLLQHRLKINESIETMKIQKLLSIFGIKASSSFRSRANQQQQQTTQTSNTHIAYSICTLLCFLFLYIVKPSLVNWTILISIRSIHISSVVCLYSV